MLSSQKTARIFRRNEFGFTLIEILVVILIIGILASIAIPVFLNQRKKAADATIHSDIKTAAGGVETWSAGGGTPTKFAIDNGGKTSALIEGANPVNNFPAAAPRWNTLPSYPKIFISNATSMEVVMITVPQSMHWLRVHEPGEFCIKASNASSNYDGFLYGDTYATLNKSLYYDVKAGGLRTMEELVKLQVTDTTVSCSGYVNRYMSTL